MKGKLTKVGSELWSLRSRNEGSGRSEEDGLSERSRYPQQSMQNSGGGQQVLLESRATAREEREREGVNGRKQVGARSHLAGMFPTVCILSTAPPPPRECPSPLLQKLSPSPQLPQLSPPARSQRVRRRPAALPERRHLPAEPALRLPAWLHRHTLRAAPL